MIRELIKVVYLDQNGETQTFLFDELKCVNGKQFVLSGKLDGVRQTFTLEDFLYLKVVIARVAEAEFDEEVREPQQGR